MQDGSFAFYESLRKRFMIFVASSLLIGILFWVTMQQHNVGNSMIVPSLIVSCAALFCMQVLPSFFKGPLVLVHARYIKLKNTPEIAWEHINYVSLEKQFIGGRHPRKKWVIKVDVIDPYIYHLSLIQKIKIKMGQAPFSLNVDMMDTETRTQLKEQLAAYGKLKFSD